MTRGSSQGAASPLRGLRRSGPRPSAVKDHFYEKAANDPGIPQIWHYTDALSYRPGDLLSCHINSSLSRLRLVIRRDGARNDILHEATLSPRFHETPEDASVSGCAWPAGYQWRLPENWPSGGYLLRLEGETPKGERLFRDHWFALRAGSEAGDILQIAATGTWAAYNDWGGSNFYEGLCGRARDLPAHTVSLERPWSRGFCVLPSGAPRAILPGPPQTGAAPHYPHMEWAYAEGYSKKYASAGWASYDRHFAIWAESQGYRLDLATQHDLHRDPHMLDRYRAIVIVGHDEYWTWEMRDAVDAFVAQGGSAIRLGGNFLWQMRIAPDGRSQTCYKYRAREADPWRKGDRAHRLTTAWDAPEIGRPAAATFGLSGLRGIYANVGLCTPRASAGFTVYRPDHWALAGTDLYYGDLLGMQARVFGYEVDGIDYDFRDGLPYPTALPPGLADYEILAMGLATSTEIDRGQAGGDFFLGESDAAFAAEILHGRADAETIARVRYGSGMIVAFRKGKGEVFNAATCEWVNGLAQGDPAIERITRNVLDRALAR